MRFEQITLAEGYIVYSAPSEVGEILAWAEKHKQEYRLGRWYYGCGFVESKDLQDPEYMENLTWLRSCRRDSNFRCSEWGGSMVEVIKI